MRQKAVCFECLQCSDNIACRTGRDQSLSISEGKALSEKEIKGFTETPCVKIVVNTGEYKGEMKKPSIPEKPKHIDLIRKRVLDKKKKAKNKETFETYKELENVNRRTRKSISRVRNRFYKFIFKICPSRTGDFHRTKISLI